MFLSVGHEKNVIYSKLVNIPSSSYHTYIQNVLYIQVKKEHRSGAMSRHLDVFCQDKEGNLSDRTYSRPLICFLTKIRTLCTE